jgi:hypothetical protein
VPEDLGLAALRRAAIAAAVLVPSIAGAQTRAECEAGIGFIGAALAETTKDDRRAVLEKALRDAKRELGEEEYDECLEAVEDARELVAGTERGRPPPFRVDERLATDPLLPVSVDSAFMPAPGESEMTLGLIYDRIRRTVREGGDDDEEVRLTGRHRFSPHLEIEHGFTRVLSGSVGIDHRRGTTEDDLTGEVEVQARWNLLTPQGWLPALTLSGSASVPFGFNNGGTYETTVALIASQPLGSGTYAPYLHANLFWTHAIDRGEDDRLNRFGGVLGLAMPIAESTALVADVLHEQDDAKGAITNVAEIGVRQNLPGDVVLGLGTGVGFGGSTTEFRLLVGVQKSF